MKKKAKKVMMGMLMMSMLVSGALAYQTGIAVAASEPENKSVTISSTGSMPGFSQVQYKKFMSYLTQEYAPQLQTEWEKAIYERQRVQPVLQIKEATTDVDGIKADVKTSGGTEDLNLKFTPVSDEELKKILANTDLPEGAKVTAYKAEGTDGKVVSVTIETNDTDKAKAGNVQVTGCNGLNNVSIFMDSNGEEVISAEQKLQNELDQAITDNDSKAIKTVLGEMLNNYKQTTEDLKTALSKVEATQK